MLNYILPPIIIVISVSILIMFLFRKAEEIPQQELENNEKESQSSRRFALFVSALGQFGLKVLERIMHRSKLFSLKLHNMSNDWFQSIREKRQEKMRSIQEPGERETPKVQEPQDNFAQVQKPYRRDEVVRPMIREKVTRPQPAARIIEKNKLEDALIKRIAINPRDIEAYERLGDYYLESDNFQDSLACFRQVLKLSPTHQKARLRIRRLERALK
jgi:tetratricopeptide (TPR) repeat protein